MAALSGVCVLISACASAPEASPLYTALQKNPVNASELEKFLREDPGAKTPDGNSCLYYAITAEKLDAAEILISGGARLSREELYALFDPYKKRTETRRYQFLAPAFYGNTIPYESALKPPRKYTCTAGDTIIRIAKKLHCSEQDLKTVNPLTNFSRLRPGTKINIPLDNDQ